MASQLDVTAARIGVEKLYEENERLRAALREIAYRRLNMVHQRIAREALGLDPNVWPLAARLDDDRTDDD